MHGMIHVMRTRTAPKAFTLIELLVVIAIIGILSSVVLASMNSARKKGRDARRLQDVKSLQVALELSFDANSAYPTTTAGTPVILATGTGAGQIAAAYISTIPKDPLSTGTGATIRNYYYAGTTTSYCLGALLENTSGANDACGTTASTPGADVTGSTAGLAAITGYSTTLVYKVQP
jgi:prepilin-type N-terminal cleavage/methylation domain-containing protein